ncbi:MAG: HAMP domain-containing sensor histidine kinase [Mycobacteriales bacterium]
MTPSGHPGRARSLRTRVRNAIALVATLALLLFGIPLAVVMDRLIHSQALTGLQRDATRAVAAVPDNTLEAASPPEAPVGRGDTRLGVYDAQGTLIAGVGPTHSVLAARAGDGREHDGNDSNDLAVVVPVLSDTTVAGSVRAAVPRSVLHHRSYEAWALLAGLAVAVIGVATAMARRAAKRISRPFEHITEAARQLGGGRYDVHLPHSGIQEADEAGEALRVGAKAVDDLLRHEREFVRDASHQLRTPLAALRLFLDQQPPDLAGVRERAEHLETTIADLLAVRTVSTGESCAAELIAAEAVQRWSSDERPVTLRNDVTEPVAFPAAALRQSLDVLLDNAIRHGGGPVTVTIEPYGDAVLIEVADQGAGFPPGALPGTGLQMVTSAVERAGGSLLVRRRAPHARVALLLPAAQSVS